MEKIFAAAVFLSFISCYGLVACYNDDEVLNTTDNALLFMRTKQQNDECQIPSERCRLNVLQTCQATFHFTAYSDFQDCTATGQTCTVTGTYTAQCM